MKHLVISVLTGLTVGFSIHAQEIVCPGDAAELERYAAKELQRYLDLVSGSMPEIHDRRQDDGKPCFILAKQVGVPGPQGYALKRDAVTDISSLGNLVSVQNRFVLQNYLPHEMDFGPPPAIDAPLHPVVISPPASVPAGQFAVIKVRVLDSRDYAAVSATIHWSIAGAEKWNTAPMTRRVKAIFTGAVPAAGLVEYYIAVAEGSRTARFPVDGNLTFVSTGTAPETLPPAPKNYRADGKTLAWDAANGAFWYKLYRDGRFLTYVAAGTLGFSDGALDLSGRPLAGPHDYQDNAVDKAGCESQRSVTARIAYP